jgi:sugar phosphate permease
LGATVLVVATSLLLLALNWGGSTYAWPSPQILGLLAASALFWALFAARLLKAAEPLISLEVLSNRIVLAGTLSMFLLQAASIGLSVYLPVYLQAVLGLTAGESGMAMLGLLLGTVAGATTSGKLVPRFFHYKRIALIGIAFAIVCLGLLAHVAGSASLTVVEVLTALIGFGTGTSFPVATVSVHNAVDRSHLGVATGVLTFLRSLGGALGVAALGTIALSRHLPLAGEGMATSAGHMMEGNAFGVIFLFAASMLVGSFVILCFMPNKPLRSGAPVDAPLVE